MRPARLVGARSAGARSQMFRVAQGARVLAKARKGGAGGRGAQREALTQHPGEWRIEGEEFDPTKRDWHRRGKPRRRRLRRRQRQLFGAAPKTEIPALTMGWSARNSARQAAATAAAAKRPALRPADRRREFHHRMGRRHRTRTMVLA